MPLSGKIKLADFVFREYGWTVRFVKSAGVVGLNILVMLREVDRTIQADVLEFAPLEFRHLTESPFSERFTD
jgi:hypothetical protein